MKSWRPDNWQVIVCKKQDDIAETLRGKNEDISALLELGIEAGADAMLNKLRLNSVCFIDVMSEQSVAVVIKTSHRGRVVFIPDDEEG